MKTTNWVKTIPSESGHYWIRSGDAITVAYLDVKTTPVLAFVPGAVIGAEGLEFWGDKLEIPDETCGQ